MIEETKIRVSLKPDNIDESYNIVIGENLFLRVASYLKDSRLGSRYAIISDSNVGPLYASSLERFLSNLGLPVDTFIFPAGEQSKTVETCLDITGQMSKKRFGRDSAIIALGGGVVGDMAGFMAYVFNRGVPYIQVPTTVLAQADSSVGGKVAIDTNEGKNLWGGFKHPKSVYIDIRVLDTLPVDEIRNGLAETIKHGVIASSDLFGYLRDNMDLFFKPVGSNLRDSAFRDIARYNCRIKGSVVEKDPKEKGLRRI